MFFLADYFFSEMYIEQMTTFVSTLYRYVQVKLLKLKKNAFVFQKNCITTLKV